ncbi:MAG: DNA polymerase/3'-5' exonuclease PolX [Tepidisphaera sp.]
MSFNANLAEAFSRAAKVLEILGEDSFRINALARASRTFEDYPGDLGPLAENRAALLAVPGVGAKIADKVIEFRKSGTIAEFDEIIARVPAGLLDLLQLPGLGPKTVAVLWNQGGVTDLAGLKRIIDDGSILTLPRMGAKSVEKLKQSMTFSDTVGQRQNTGVITPLAERLAARVRALPGVRRCEYAGSLRRGRETVGDLDLLVEADDAASISAAFRSFPEVTAILSAGDRKSSVMVAAAGGAARWGSGQVAQIQADLKVVPPGRFGAALMYFTGSKDHNVHLREIAQKKGLTLNEYGLFPAPAPGSEPPSWADIHPIAAATEEDVFAALGFRWIPPELREASAEFDLFATAATAPAAAIHLSDIKAELHAHTTASDGRLSIEELASAASERGFHTIAVTDHSRSSAQAGGLSVERLLQHIEDVRRAQEKLKHIQILAGSEVDILADGTLDYPDEVLKQLDIVVASPHTALSQDEETATHRLLAAVRHPLVSILGHPTGRLINRRPGLSPRMGEIFAAAKENRVALEINSHWMRLDLRDTHVREAVRLGCLIAIDCDVHEREDFDNLRYGIATARRGWVHPAGCVNAWSAVDIRTWCHRNRR